MKFFPSFRNFVKVHFRKVGLLLLQLWFRFAGFELETSGLIGFDNALGAACW